MVKLEILHNGISIDQTQLRRRLGTTMTMHQKQNVKALDTAIRVEGFRLRKQLIKEIKTGAPGGQKFAPLSVLARRMQTFGSKGNALGRKKALHALAKVVRYDRIKTSPIEMHIGFVGDKISRSWQRIAMIQQTGGTRPFKKWFREWAATAGGRMSKRSRNRKYFFLKKTTTQATIPARPIIEPFWKKHRSGVARNIEKNWRDKLAGKRI